MQKTIQILEPKGLIDRVQLQAKQSREKHRSMNIIKAMPSENIDPALDSLNQLILQINKRN